MSNYVLEYWNEIESGKVLVSNRVKRVYKQLANEILNPKGDWIFDESLSNKPVNFIETFCKNSKGEWMGKPISLMLFQKAYIAALFGFVHKETRLRRFKETFFLVARKNGKSTLLSGIMLYMMMADGEGGAQIVSAATKKEQASIVFSECVNMVTQSPLLSKHLKKRKTDLFFPATFSTMNALSSDSNTLDGLNVHLAVIDELHAIKDRNLYEVIKQGMSTRRQPLLVMITTSGTVRECIYDDMYDYACKVVDGTIEDDRFLSVLYELDERAEWTKPECWIKSNPSIGIIKKLEDIQEKVEKAKASPKDLPGILCKDFNVRDTVAGMWLNFDYINNEETFDIEDFRDCYAIGGVDLSSTTDLTCATLIFMRRGSDKKYVIQKYFLPDEHLQRRINEDKIPYDLWKNAGLLKASEGNKINYTDVTNWFASMFQNYGVRPLWIGYDPWNAQYWVDEMKNFGFEMVEIRQGYKTLSSPMKEMEADLMSHSINYNNNPILKWCLTNTSIKSDDNDNIRPVKGNNQRQRIDGAVSLLIAYALLHEKLGDYKNMI